MEGQRNGRQKVCFVQVALGKVHTVALGGLDKALAGLRVQIAVGCKGPHHHTVCTGTAGGNDVVDHQLHLVGGIEEVTRTGTDKYMATHAIHLHGGIDEPKAGREPTLGEAAAKFHTEGSALGGTLHAQEGAAADFKFA